MAGVALAGAVEGVVLTDQVHTEQWQGQKEAHVSAAVATAVATAVAAAVAVALAAAAVANSHQ